jgi:hypothetical protein
MTESGHSRWHVVDGGRGRVPALVELDRLIAESAPEDRPALVVQLAARLAQLGAVLAIPAQASDQRRAESAPEGSRGGKLLTAQEAASIAGVSPRWLRRHTKGLRFRQDLSRKLARFEGAGFRRWLQARGA